MRDICRWIVGLTFSMTVWLFIALSMAEVGFENDVAAAASLIFGTMLIAFVLMKAFD